MLWFTLGTFFENMEVKVLCIIYTYCGGHRLWITPRGRLVLNGHRHHLQLSTLAGSLCPKSVYLVGEVKRGSRATPGFIAIPSNAGLYCYPEQRRALLLVCNNHGYTGYVQYPWVYRQVQPSEPYSKKNCKN